MELTTVTVSLVSKTDVFRSTSQEYTLSAIPFSGVDVWVFYNGLYMTEGVDFQRSGDRLTFTTQTIGQDPIVVVKYRAVLV
jgi:hypothetical protein